MKTLEINNHIIVFQDECGIQEDLVRTHGRCEKGRRLIGLKTATKHNKTGIIAGYTKLPNEKQYLYISPFYFNDNCDTLLFNFWLENIFIPEVKILQRLYPNNPISLVIDNVPYHKSNKTVALCNENQINLVFQSPYSPDLNPIEPSWNTAKNDIRNCSYIPITFHEKLTKALLSRTWNI